jgi:hypothetical protein
MDPHAAVRISAGPLGPRAASGALLAAAVATWTHGNGGGKKWREPEATMGAPPVAGWARGPLARSVGILMPAFSPLSVAGPTGGAGLLKAGGGRRNCTHGAEHGGGRVVACLWVPAARLALLLLQRVGAQAQAPLCGLPQASCCAPAAPHSTSSAAEPTAATAAAMAAPPPRTVPAPLNRL